MITLFGVLSYVNSKESLEEQYKNNAESVLAHTMLTFEYDFSSVETILNQLSQSQILQVHKDSTKDEISELLRMYKNISQIKGDIYYGLENGEIYRSIDIELPDGYNPIDQEWYQLAKSNPDNVVWTEPYFHHVTQDIIISALKTVESSDNIQAVLVIDFSLSQMSNQISDAKIGKDGLVMLLSSSGKILANRDNYMIGESLFEDSYTQLIEDTQTSYVKYDIDEKKYLVHSDTIQQNGMNIVTAISTEEIAQTLLQRHLTVFFVGLISILLFSIITHLAIIREVKPLNKLGGLMSSVENGDYDVHAKINDYKEINRLSNGFNSMISAIKKRDEDLIISNKELMIAKEKLRGKYEELKKSQTILKASEEKILRLASYDSLTGLLNRRSLLEILTKSIEYKDVGSLTAIIFIDLDNFKMINDSLGHSFGDKVIIEVANKLNLITDYPKDVARISGDEFIVVIHDIESVGQVEEAAKQIVNLFNVPITVKTKQLNIMASVGISIYRPCGYFRRVIKNC
jgi:diguanylate cyclase (GGDEF)-like protein